MGKKGKAQVLSCLAFIPGLKRGARGHSGGECALRELKGRNAVRDWLTFPEETL